ARFRGSDGPGLPTREFRPAPFRRCRSGPRSYSLQPHLEEGLRLRPVARELADLDPFVAAGEGRGVADGAGPQPTPWRRRCSARTSSTSSGTGPSTTAPGTTSWRGSGGTGAGGTPTSASHSASCAAEATYTMRPSPTHPCAAAHIGQCSPEV